MFTVAIVASDPSDKASAAEFASSSLNAAVVFRDSVAAALEHSPLFDCIIACEDSFRDALKDSSLFLRLSGTTVLCLLDKLFFKIDLSQKGSSRSEARASALLSSLMAKCGFRRGTLGCGYIRDAVLMCLFLDDPRHKLSKDIYPKIAQKHNVRPDNVERSIRNAIRAADSDPISHEHLRALIGNVRPSNSEVISALTQKLSEEFFRDSTRD